MEKNFKKLWKRIYGDTFSDEEIETLLSLSKEKTKNTILLVLRGASPKDMYQKLNQIDSNKYNLPNPWEEVNISVKNSYVIELITEEEIKNTEETRSFSGLEFLLFELFFLIFPKQETLVKSKIKVRKVFVLDNSKEISKTTQNLDSDFFWDPEDFIK